MKLYALAVGSAILVTTSYAKEVTIKVESSSYLDATLVFPIDGNKINALSKTFSTQGPQFNKACSLYGAIDAEGRINTQVKLDLTGFNLEDGRTLLVASVNASKAGPTSRQSILGKDGKLTKTADCPSTTRLSFTTRAIIKPGETLDLSNSWDAKNNARLKLSAISP